MQTLHSIEFKRVALVRQANLAVVLTCSLRPWVLDKPTAPATGWPSAVVQMELLQQMDQTLNIAAIVDPPSLAVVQMVVHLPLVSYRDNS